MSNESIRKKVSHGTSSRSLVKALETYMNKTGAGDYDLPELMGAKQTVSEKKNPPCYTF